MYKIIANVPYGTDPLQKVDWLLPENLEDLKGDNLGLHIHYHGGAWTSGDKNDELEVTLAKHASSIVCSQDADNTIIALINYRLSGTVNLADIYEDVYTSFKGALQAALAHGLNLNKTKITLSGTSAGAHLVASMVSRPFDLKKTYLNLIQDVVLYSLPANLPDYTTPIPHPDNTALDPAGYFWDWTELDPGNPSAVPPVDPFVKFNALGTWINSWLISTDFVDYNPQTLMEDFRTDLNFIPKFNLHMFHGANDLAADPDSANAFLTAYETLTSSIDNTVSMKMYGNSGHAMEELLTDTTQQISTLLPHPYTTPTDSSHTFTEEDLDSLTTLLEGFKSATSSPPKFDHENAPAMNVDTKGIPTLSGGTITLAPGAFTACGDNSTIAFLDANLFKIIDKARSIDKNMSALAWSTELQTLGNDIVNTMRDELNIQSLSDILDNLPKPIGSIAEDLIKIGLLMESVKGGGIDMVTLNKVMAAFDTDYKDVLNGLGLDANKIVKTLGDLQKNPVSTILSETGLCDKIPNISKLASGEIKELLGPVELAISNIENEIATPADIIIVSADKIKEDIETELKNIKELSSKNEDITKQMIPDYNQFVGNSLAISNILKLRTPIMDNPAYVTDNPIGGSVEGIPSYYTAVKSITDISEKIDSGIPKSLPGLINADQSIHQMHSFVNNKSSEEDPRGPSGQTIANMWSDLESGINFTTEELINFTDPSSVINAIKSKLPDKDSVLFPKDPLNFDNLNDPSVVEINKFNENVKLNDYIATSLKNDNRTRLNSYITQRNLNDLPEIEDSAKDSMWKNDPYFEMDFLKENAGYTNLEYRTNFTPEELEAVKIKFNLSEE
jgi:hypothetical protein